MNKIKIDVDNVLKRFSLGFFIYFILLLAVPSINQLYETNIAGWGNSLAFTFGWLLAYMFYVITKNIIKLIKRNKEAKNDYR